MFQKLSHNKRIFFIIRGGFLAVLGGFTSKN